MARPPRVVPASYSSIRAYETCPKQFYHLRIAKDYKQEESPQMAWGNKVHKALENNIKYGHAIPGNMKHFTWALDLVHRAADSMNLFSEVDVGVTKDRSPTGFWYNDCYVRGKIDVLAMDEEQTKALNGDWKTGKTKPNSKQLVLSSLIVLHTYPNIERLVTSFFWLPEPDPRKRTTRALFVRQDSGEIQLTEKGSTGVHSIDELWEPFENTIDQMEWSLKYDTWPAKPSGLCKAWCPVLSCPHNGRRK